MNEENRRYTCVLCGSAQLEELHTTKTEVFVTGDRKKFESRGMIIKRVICKDCGTVQFLQNKSYKDAVNEVYQNYEVMHDKVWSPDSKEHKPRLQVIYKKISEKLHLPETGNMIDIGCGGGESLFWFHQMYPKWNLYGLDIGEQFRQAVTTQEGVKDFFSSLEELSNSNIRFNFITINNVLSLAGNAARILESVKECLDDEGIFFVKDADYEVHPWLLYEIECASFYTRKQMGNVLQGFGFDILNINLELEQKEIGLFCKKGNVSWKKKRNIYELNKNIYNTSIEYLDRVIDAIGEYTEKNAHIGIFGTSIAAIWVSQIIVEGGYAITDKEIFYIEEDEDYLHKKVGVNGYPIYPLGEYMKPAVVFLPFPRYIAESIKKRCEKDYHNLHFIVFE